MPLIQSAAVVVVVVRWNRLSVVATVVVGAALLLGIRCDSAEAETVVVVAAADIV